MTDGRDDDGDADAPEGREHLADFEGCAGCVEVWEHLSERRERESGEVSDERRGSPE